MLGEREHAEDQARYVVHLEVFEGPLDLLLHLIEKRQMEITTVSLLAVTDQYIAYLQQWQERQLPLASMAAFVSIAARLLYIKSQSLLPQLSRAEKGGDESMVGGVEVLQQHHRANVDPAYAGKDGGRDADQGLPTAIRAAKSG